MIRTVVLASLLTMCGAIIGDTVHAEVKWAKPENKCINGIRRVSAKLEGLNIFRPDEWKRACEQKRGNFKKFNIYRKPDRCEVPVAGVWGEWDLEDERCMRKLSWSELKKKCVNFTLQVSAKLKGLSEIISPIHGRPGDWERACVAKWGNFKQFNINRRPDRCVNVAGTGIWGEWDEFAGCNLDTTELASKFKAGTAAVLHGYELGDRGNPGTDFLGKKTISDCRNSLMDIFGTT